jgi:hypothetical protein
LNGNDCNRYRIKEYYSFTPVDADVLIGNFPIGTLLRRSNGAVSLTNIAAPQLDDWEDPLGTRYRESQSVTNAYGSIFVGMYPWSELFMIDSRTQEERVARLIQKPEKDGSPTPFFWPMHQRAKSMHSVDFDAKAEVVYSLLSNGKSLRHAGLEPTHWAQRIPSITVLSGRLCASTGNLGGYPYDPSKHPDISLDLVEQYGSIFCANLKNHIMTSYTAPKFESETENKMDFIVTNSELIISVGGKALVKERHYLSDDDLLKLERRKQTSN